MGMCHAFLLRVSLLDVPLHPLLCISRICLSSRAPQSVARRPPPHQEMSAFATGRIPVMHVFDVRTIRPRTSSPVYGAPRVHTLASATAFHHLHSQISHF